MEHSLVERLRRKAAHTLSGPSVPQPNTGGMLSVTFDDFPRTAWTEGGAVLAAHGVKGTYYVSGGFCGGVLDDQEQGRETDLADLHESGHEVGCHTFDHVSALKVSEPVFARSIEANARFLAERLDGLTMASFAYPYGDVSFGARKTVAANGMTGRLAVGGCNGTALRPRMLTALALEAGRREAERWEEYIAQAAAERLWLIIVTHDVQDRPSKYGCTPKTLDTVLAAARTAGLEIKPVGTVMPMVTARAA